MTLVFSKSKQGTAHKPVVTPAMTTNAAVAYLSYNMISRLANSKNCGKCSGAK
jgi:hypothetical protein